MTTLKGTKSMGELAEAINAHLKRFEADPVLNKKSNGQSRFYCAAAAYSRGPKLFVTYITYQGPCRLSKDEATRYLAKLDAGFVGRHFEALRESA